RDDRAADTRLLGGVEGDLRPLDVEAIELLGVLGLARDLARAVEEARAALRGGADARAVGDVAAEDGHAAVLELGLGLAAPGRGLVAAGGERGDEVRAEEAGGAGDEVTHRHHPRLKTFWKVWRSSTSFDLIAPERNSAAPGVYDSRTILVKISALVL